MAANASGSPCTIVSVFILDGPLKGMRNCLTRRDAVCMALPISHMTPVYQLLVGDLILHSCKKRQTRTFLHVFVESISDWRVH
eukprot:2859-Amphidinium_carterae.1